MGHHVFYHSLLFLQIILICEILLMDYCSFLVIAIVAHENISMNIVYVS